MTSSLKSSNISWNLGDIIIKNNFTILCFIFAVVLACSSPSVTFGNDKGLATTFAKMLQKSINASDFVAQVEIIKYWPGKRSKNKTLYHIEAKVLEAFKGPSLESVEFYQWVVEGSKGEAMENENITRQRVIVALENSGHDHSYRVPIDSYTFPSDKNLLDVARKCCGNK
ncbi:MAG: hypothetical protein ACQ9MH_10805 [Nitrospinales bacterium]